MSSPHSVFLQHLYTELRYFQRVVFIFYTDEVGEVESVQEEISFHIKLCKYLSDRFKLCVLLESIIPYVYTSSTAHSENENFIHCQLYSQQC